MQLIFVENQKILAQVSEKELVAGDWVELDLSPYFMEVLAFCRDWLDDSISTFDFFTSGSTGQPKTIQLAKNQMKASAQKTLEFLALEKGDAALVSLNTRFIGGKMMLVRGMEGDLQMVVTEPCSLPLTHVPDVFELDFISWVPFQLSTLLEKDLDSLQRLHQLKALILGGAPVGAVLEQQIRNLSFPVFHTFGMTETVSHIALRRLDGAGYQDYFECLPGCKIKADNRGCLLIQADWLDGIIVTNDQVDVLDDRKFIWQGRADHVINSGGLKFQLEKVESAAEIALFGLKDHRRSIAIGVPDEKLGERLELVIESFPFNEEKKDRLMKVLAEALDKYELPKSIHFLQEFPLTASGKVDRLAILSRISA